MSDIEHQFFSQYWPMGNKLLIPRPLVSRESYIRGGPSLLAQRGLVGVRIDRNSIGGIVDYPSISGLDICVISEQQVLPVPTEPCNWQEGRRWSPGTTVEIVIGISGKSTNITETQNKYEYKYDKVGGRSSSSNTFSNSITTYPAPKFLKGRTSEIRAVNGRH